MKHSNKKIHRWTEILFMVLVFQGVNFGQSASINWVNEYARDRDNLMRFYPLRSSASRLNRLEQFHRNWQIRLDGLDQESLDVDARLDWILLSLEVTGQLRSLELERDRLESTLMWLPFAPRLVEVFESRQRLEPGDPEAQAALLTGVDKEVKSLSRQWQGEADESLEEVEKGGRRPSAVEAERASRLLRELANALRDWREFYHGYDPLHSWWIDKPSTDLERSLRDYADGIKNKFVGEGEGMDQPLVGDPIGREALSNALERELIPYSPEELVTMAEIEFDWCRREYLRAARELGFGNDWKAALDYVKSKHVGPGEQPALIKDLAEEAVTFLEDRNLLTLPEVAKETWRMQMMTPERQKVNPYFTGGEVISVSFPTDRMAHEDKLMSMRGNNVHFSRATVHHELIPGHHLQLYMADRYATHRKVFRTPFFVEGWALYWEMLLWDLGFQQSAEDRIGMLFWRSHRCARIIFSLRFHLGMMTPEECIDYLVENVGHERRNATAEVRRSIQGGYSPLYQAAYMLGGLQIRELYRELVKEGDWSAKRFHDALLRENSIPVALIRAKLTGALSQRSELEPWRFYPKLEAVSGEAKQAEVKSTKRRKGARVYKTGVDPHWFDGDSKFWYRNDLGDGRHEFILVDAELGLRQPAFDSSRLASALTRLLKQEIDPLRLPFRSIEVSDDVSSIVFSQGDGSWRLTLSTYELERVEAIDAAPATLPARSDLVASGGSSKEVYLTFQNRLAEAVNLFWIDASMRLQPYGSLGAGSIRRQHTFETHAWAVQKKDGERVAVFVAEGSDSIAMIDGRIPEIRSEDRSLKQIRNQGPGVRSPDGQWEAVVKGHDLYLKDRASEELFRLTSDGTPGDSFRRDRRRERAISLRYGAEDESLARPEVYWSPNSEYLIAFRTQRGGDRRVHLIESSPDDRLQPKLDSYPYLKPGDPIPIRKPKLFHVDKRQEIPVEDDLFSNPWRINHMAWLDDSSAFRFVYNQRGHQVMRVVEINGLDGRARAVIDERCKTFFDYQGKFFYLPIEKTDEILWMSERDGWNHLYLWDGKTGAMKQQLTKGSWVVRSVEKVDVDSRWVRFKAGGVDPNQDPYHLHTCRINFDGTGFVVLTDGDGSHEVTYSPDDRFMVDRFSRVDLPPKTVLREAATGRFICDLEEADTSEFGGALDFPERFVAMGRDGSTPIYGIIHRPSKLDPSKSYPVIESIYAGPHSAHVPKTFRTRYSQRRLTEKGFIVVQIDGMGTSHRSKAFHDVCWKNLGDAGFPDRIAWLQAAAEKYPYMNLDRVGIYGGSAGGQNAMGGLLRHPSFYKVAVADCGCHDNRMDKIWWNELWMSWPIGPHYEASSNVENAHKLQGKLLLIVGELDRNVDPASTMQVVDALVKADKDFDMLVIPGVGHGAAGTPYGRRRLESFFVEHL